jgi:hypothetical protein
MRIVDAGKVDDLKIKFPEFSEEIDELFQKDPSRKGKYLEWSIRQLQRGHTLPDLIPSIEFFEKNQSRFKIKDINQYGDLKDLENEIKDLPQFTKREEKKQLKSTGSQKIYEDDKSVLIRIDSKQACVEYGKGTRWCITMEDTDYWAEYKEKNVIFYFLINKTLPQEDPGHKTLPQEDPSHKIAICVLRNESNKVMGVELYDAEDTRIKESEVDQKFINLAKSDAEKQPISHYMKPKDGIWTNPDDPKHKEYFKNGEFHRQDGPAVEQADGTREWYLNGKHHRQDGPAVERADGTREWWLNGKQHREDGPAVEWPDGTRAWLLNGKLHRQDGPAIEYPDGTREWYLNGKHHRQDGPAVEYPDGYRAWWLNGKRHRQDGPAVEYQDGTREWWLNGKRHRQDGPAVENPDGYRVWYLNGERFENQKDFLKKLEKIVSEEEIEPKVKL